MDAVADQPQVRRSEYRTSLRGRGSAFAPNLASAARGKKGEYTFVRMRQSSYQKAGQGCNGSLVSGIQTALIAQRPARSPRQSPLLEAGRRLSSSLGSAGS